MLTIPGSASRYCDGVSRRSFLRIGALGMGGLSLPGLLEAESRSGKKIDSHKAVIMIYLPGGPPHQDMVDLKIDAPSEFRGEFRPISTRVPGVQICEHLPRLAASLDRYVTIRSIVGSDGGHDNHQCFTGRSERVMPEAPSMGSVVSRLEGPVIPGVPPYVGLEPRMRHRPYNLAGPGFLGVSHRSFRPTGEGREDMVLDGISVDRLHDRKSLLASLDRFRRDTDASGRMSALDEFNQQALGLLTSSRLTRALDLGQEDPKTLARYGKGDPRERGDAASRINEQFLIARRLVEAGVRFVTVAFGFWDYHGNNFKTARDDLPRLDQAVTALVDDLHDRGLDRDVSVVVWGEFGRTPKINAQAGRDHWPRVSCALLAGGGMKTGQVIGATDRLAGEVVERPVHIQEVLATLYHNLGISVDTATVEDRSGRPHHLVDGYRPIAEVL